MNLDRLINLLASGLPAAQVASILGVSPGRISQILSQEEVQAKIKAKELELAEGDIEKAALDGKYHAAEHALIDQVTNMAPIAELRDVTAALRVIAERQDRQKILRNPVPVGGQGGMILNQVIQLTLPQHALPEITLSKEKEIISIGERNLAPMTSTGVINLFKQAAPTLTTCITKEENDSTRIPTSTKETHRETLEEDFQAFLRA